MFVFQNLIYLINYWQKWVYFLKANISSDEILLQILCSESNNLMADFVIPEWKKYVVASSIPVVLGSNKINVYQSIWYRVFPYLQIV